MGCEVIMVLNIQVRFVWVLLRWRHRVLLKYGSLFHKLQGITSYNAIILMEDWFYSEHVENAHVDTHSIDMFFVWHIQIMDVWAFQFTRLSRVLLTSLGMAGCDRWFYEWLYNLRLRWFPPSELCYMYRSWSCSEL